jgi:hypothetical protein
MIAPAADQMAADFGIHNSVVLAMSISVFVLAYGTFAVISQPMPPP